jgi:prepilin-type N-terminal cleavage/methylation domain-containing protein/prepilin-type processing-associated H-X9-DG protein
MKLKGFTLIELLVVMALISLMTALVMPSIGRAKETARRLLCTHNLHSIGTGLKAYETVQHDALPAQYDRWGPDSETYSTDFLEPWVSYVAYHKDVVFVSGKMQPLQLAKLYENNILENPKVFYCSSQTRRGDNFVFTYEYYTKRTRSIWGSALPTKTNGQPDDKIRSSYHYWLHGKKSLANLSLAPVVFDNIQHWNSVAHTHSGQPYGVNALFGDGHVNFTSDQTLFDRQIWNGGPDAGPWDGPGNSRDLFNHILALLDP